MIRYSYATYNHSPVWGVGPCLPEQIEGAAAAGYQYIGFDVPSVIAHEASGDLGAADLRELAAAYGLSCYELLPLRITDGGAETDHQLDLFVRLAAELGVAQVLGLVSMPLDATAVAVTRRCTTELAAVGVGLSLEFMPTLPFNSVSTMRRLVEAVEHPNLKMVVDSWHFGMGPSSWASLEELPPELLGFVQFSDALPPASADLLFECRHRRTLPGRGMLDLRRFAATVGPKVGDLCVSVEVLSADWRARPPAELAVAARRATVPYWDRGIRESARLKRRRDEG